MKMAKVECSTLNHDGGMNPEAAKVITNREYRIVAKTAMTVLAIGETIVILFNNR
jgi:hypothetical protein